MMQSYIQMRSEEEYEKPTCFGQHSLFEMPVCILLGLWFLQCTQKLLSKQSQPFSIVCSSCLPWSHLSEEGSCKHPLEKSENDDVWISIIAVSGTRHADLVITPASWSTCSWWLGWCFIFFPSLHTPMWGHGISSSCCVPGIGMMEGPPWPPLDPISIVGQK